ncbi:HNH endonuclease signature motif containing protein [Mitsuokella sp.]|uniref:HNH endonuclease signature motif containing protein n=1 Tax=Mitsuokella sp. TaxID=2049034 RepID=UPI002A7F73B4|nr:HNH endonuclease signature motif containing protein [Mitsuokella sp.]MDY4473968.1 HNH endonuclease signature motif containing protein [Mitsuokella sp.]
MSEKKNPKETSKTVEQRLQQTADELQERIRYYSESEEGQEEIRQTVYQAGRVIGGAANLIWTIARSVTGCMARKACDYYEAGQQAKDGNYKAAGKKIAEMQVRRAKGMAQAAATAAGTVCNGVKAACTEDTEAAKKFRHGLRNCAVIGGTILVASEAVDAIEVDGDGGAITADDSALPTDDDALPDAYGTTDLLPTIAIDDMPGVEDGMLLDNSPNNLAELAEAGEFHGTHHLSEVMRSQEARLDFLAQHDLERIPAGWEIHHVVPLSEGGADTPDNMVLLRAEDHDWITTQHRMFYGWPGPEYWQAAT